jgi:hypothetical protein
LRKGSLDLFEDWARERFSATVVGMTETPKILAAAAQVHFSETDFIVQLILKLKVVAFADDQIGQ